MNFDNEIALLRKQRIKSIEACDFAEAKALDLQIQKLLQTKDDHSRQQSMTSAQLKYNIERENVRTKASEIYNQFYTKVYEAKSKFHKRRALLQQSHATTLANIANEYAKELEIETTRPIPEADTLKREAQIRAKSSDYETAEKLFKESTNKREFVTQQRQSAVHLKYKQLREAAEAKQDEELRLCTRKQNQAFVEIKTDYDAEIKKLDRQLSACAIRLGVQRPVEEEQGMFKELIIEGVEIQPDEIHVATLLSPGKSPQPQQSPLLSPRSKRSPTQSPKQSPAKLSPKQSPKGHEEEEEKNFQTPKKQ